MKEEIYKFFKPTVPKIIYVVVIVTWQYFYSFKGYDLGLVGRLNEYIRVGLGGVNWGNFFIRNLSLFLVWIVVALIIYLFFLGWEYTENLIHNFKIKLTYEGQAVSDYSHLLRVNQATLRTHVISQLLKTGGVFLLVLGFSFVSNIVETFRAAIADSFYWQIAEGGVVFSPENQKYVIVTFLGTLPFWYFYGSLIFFIFRESRIEAEEAEITEEHFSAVNDEDSAFGPREE